MKAVRGCMCFKALSLEENNVGNEMGSVHCLCRHLPHLIFLTKLYYATSDTIPDELCDGLLKALAINTSLVDISVGDFAPSRLKIGAACLATRNRFGSMLENENTPESAVPHGIRHLQGNGTVMFESIKLLAVKGLWDRK